MKTQWNGVRSKTEKRENKRENKTRGIAWKYWKLLFKITFESRLSPSHIEIVDSNSNLTISLLHFWSVINVMSKKMILIKICYFKHLFNPTVLLIPENFRELVTQFRESSKKNVWVSQNRHYMLLFNLAYITEENNWNSSVNSKAAKLYSFNNNVLRL